MDVDPRLVAVDPHPVDVDRPAAADHPGSMLAIDPLVTAVAEPPAAETPEADFQPAGPAATGTPDTALSALVPAKPGPVEAAPAEPDPLLPPPDGNAPVGLHGLDSPNLDADAASVPFLPFPLLVRLLKQPLLNLFTH